jgi:uncharacterized protein (TIGR02246 family)
MTNTPQDLHKAWADRFSAGDLDGLVDLYEEDAVLVPAPGAEPLHGKAAIRDALGGFLAPGAAFALQQTRTLEASGVGVAYSTWTLEGGRGEDGQPLELSGETTDIVRRQADGSWRFVIDNPWGVAG